MDAVTRPAGQPGFTAYLNDRTLPIRRADVRALESTPLTMALVEHAPADGIEYRPVQELIISIVLRARHAPVLRDIGCGSQRFNAMPGQVLLTPPSCGSYWRFEGNPLVLHLGVALHPLAQLLSANADLIESRIKQLARRQLNEPLVGQIARRLWDSGSGAGEGGSYAPNYLGAILALLLEASPAADDAGRKEVPALPAWRLRKTMEAIDGAGHAPSVAQLARSVALSPDHFSRSFKASTGRPPYQVLSEMRIERAKALLRESRLSITELALDLGFSSPAHFSSRFRQLTGLTPSAWRAASVVPLDGRSGQPDP